MSSDSSTSSGPSISGSAARLTALLGKMENEETLKELGEVILELQVLAMLEEGTTPVFTTSLVHLQHVFDETKEVSLTDDMKVAAAFVKLRGMVGALLIGLKITQGALREVPRSSS